MKKAFLCLVSLSLAVALWGCVPQKAVPEENTPTPAEPMKGIWIAYYELPFQGLSEGEFHAQINGMMDNLADGGFNTVFCHVRPYCDAIYPSEIFPWSNAEDRSTPQGTDPGYDPLAIIIDAAHSRGIALHAWINPYRVATALPNEGEAYSYLAEGHPVRKWMTDGDSSNDDFAVVVNESGRRSIYLNPAIPQVNKLICDGVREILQNYKVDGIHFDDYFYPTTDPAFDSAAYGQYVASGGAQSLDDWRRSNVNAMVSAVYSVVKSFGSTFGISPAAAISEDKTDRNYVKLYADIRLWAEKAGYVDYLLPQLYFGYLYPKEKFRFPRLLADWCAIKRHGGLKLYVGLGPYKQGEEDAGSDEWIKYDDIIERQIADSNKYADGTVLFSYSSVFK